MDNVARLPARDRRDLFAEAAAALGMHPAIIEKDFWVCAALRLLFHHSPFKNALVFKGGTSLSKVYGLIERFSEDIDLVLDWNLLGGGEAAEDPSRPRTSKAKQDKFNKDINRRAAAYLDQTLTPELNRLCAQESLTLRAAIDPTDAHVVNIHYPAAFPESYIRPEVRLEIGPLASWVPSAPHIVRPYAHSVFPHLFRSPECPVVAISAERTF